MSISDEAAAEPLIGELRSRYLDSLREPQDLHSESENRPARRRILRRAGEAIGYFFVSEAGALLEFHVGDARLAERALDHIAATHGVRRAFCKSFDALALSAYAGRAERMRPFALLFTDVEDATFTPDPAISVAVAERSDLDRIMAIDDGFFDDAEEARSYIERRRLFLYENSGELLGCGLSQPVIEGREGHDLGMLVAPPLRRRGFGEYIVRHLKARCFVEGLRPVAACGVENAASRACLEAAGFRSRHSKIELEW